MREQVQTVNREAGVCAWLTKYQFPIARVHGYQIGRVEYLSALNETKMNTLSIRNLINIWTSVYIFVLVYICVIVYMYTNDDAIIKWLSNPFEYAIAFASGVCALSRTLAYIMCPIYNWQTIILINAMSIPVNLRNTISYFGYFTWELRDNSQRRRFQYRLLNNTFCFGLVSNQRST